MKLNRMNFPRGEIKYENLTFNIFCVMNLNQKQTEGEHTHTHDTEIPRTLHKHDTRIELGYTQKDMTMHAAFNVMVKHEKLIFGNFPEGNLIGDLIVLSCVCLQTSCRRFFKLNNSQINRGEQRVFFRKLSLIFSTFSSKCSNMSCFAVCMSI